MNRKIIIVIAAVMVLMIVYGIYYLTEYNPADETVDKYLNGTINVTVIKTSNGLLLDGLGNDTALIFYPGAKLEYTSYLPMLMQLAERGIDCYLVEMPFNLAFFGQNSADELIDNSSYIHYFMAGHSLGGLVASSYLNETGKADGVIMLAAYPTKEINKPALSIYGSNDHVLSIENYQKAKPLFKSNFTELVIEGGNHAQFGNYGIRSGDGQAEISSFSQQKQTADAIVVFIN